MGRDRFRRPGPYFFVVRAHLSILATKAASSTGIEGSYDLLITNRLIAQPLLELNFYSKNDPSRGVGSGLLELDTGLRIRYEFSRKLAPYLGFAYNQTFGTTGSLTRDDGGIAHDPRFIFGLRVWY